MNDLEETLKELGVQSITVENSFNTDMLRVDDDEFGALRVAKGPNYNIELNVDCDGLSRLQEALKSIPRKPADEIKHELNVMAKVNHCQGEGIFEKIDNYFEKVDEKAKVCEAGNATALTIIGRYRIKHR